MKPRVIAIVGMPGSGKGTTVAYLETAFGLPSVHFGQMVYDEIRRRKLDIVLDERAVREDLRANEGPAVLAKRAATEAHRMLDKGAAAVVLDGLYSWSEDTYLRSEFGDSLLTIALVNPKHVRYERVVARRDAHRPYTLSQIQLRDIEEIEGIEKGGPIAFADYYIANARDVDDLHTQTHDLLQQLGFSAR